MGRNLVGSCGLIVANRLCLSTSTRGRRKSAGHIRDEAKEMFVAWEAHAVSLPYDTPGAR
jgi:hypothetical protein